MLSPYRVLDLTDHRGLLAGRMLADLGADVIRIEPPAGHPARRQPPFLPAPAADGSSRTVPTGAWWFAFSANTRSVTCDLDTEAGQRLARQLCADADVLIESSGPGVMASRSLAHADLAAEHPHLVYVSVTPFGDSGPKAGYAATDLVAWAAGGALWPNREQDMPPLRASVDQAFLHAAADAAVGALLALIERSRSGLGQHVDVSAQQSVAQATVGRILAAAVGDHTPDPRTAHRTDGATAGDLDLSGSGSSSMRSKWRVRDGHVELHLAMGPATGQFTNNLFAWLAEESACSARLAALDWRRLPELVAAGAVDASDMEAARAAVTAFLAGHTKHELMEQAIKRKLLLAPLSELDDLLSSPQLQARDSWWEAGSAEHPITIAGAFARADGLAPELRRRPPHAGEHNADVYALIGLGSDELAAHRAAGVV